MLQHSLQAAQYIGHNWYQTVAVHTFAVELDVFCVSSEDETMQGNRDSLGTT